MPITHHLARLIEQAKDADENKRLPFVPEDDGEVAMRVFKMSSHEYGTEVFDNYGTEE